MFTSLQLPGRGSSPVQGRAAFAGVEVEIHVERHFKLWDGPLLRDRESTDVD